MDKAKWMTDYDMHTDQCYQRPQCPKCMAPVLEYKEGKFRCISCHKHYELDDEMLKFIRVRQGTKIEMKDCPSCEIELNGKKINLGCGGKGCVETHYHRNPVTLEWQTAWGVCKECGRRFIV